MEVSEATDLESGPKFSKSIEAIDKTSVHKICSGQVVLNLATAVKELVENSLDAGATCVEIKLKDSGAELIQVSDNGCGVEEANFQALTLKHHTSKIRDFGDVASVSTFGFRGEALSSLCALSDVVITTRHKDANIGFKLDYDNNGSITCKTPMARQVGTTVNLSNIFSTLPVRHKEFLKNLKKEFGKMVHVLNAYCLVTKGAKIVCINQTSNNRKSTVASTQGNATFQENIVSVFGSKQIQNLLEFKQSLPSEQVLEEYSLKPEALEGEALFKIEGHVSSCVHGSGRSVADRQFYYVNDRPCDPAKLMKVVNDVYHAFNKYQYPFVFLNIRIETASVDVNITPDKRQVFMHNEKLLLAIVKGSLLKMYECLPSTFEVQNNFSSISKTPEFSGSLKRSFSFRNSLDDSSPVSKQQKLFSFLKKHDAHQTSVSKQDSPTLDDLPTDMNGTMGSTLGNHVLVPSEEEQRNAENEEVSPEDKLEMDHNGLHNGAGLREDAPQGISSRNKSEANGPKLVFHKFNLSQENGHASCSNLEDQKPKLLFHTLSSDHSSKLEVEENKPKLIFHNLSRENDFQHDSNGVVCEESASKPAVHSQCSSEEISNVGNNSGIEGSSQTREDSDFVKEGSSYSLSFHVASNTDSSQSTSEITDLSSNQVHNSKSDESVYVKENDTSTVLDDRLISSEVEDEEVEAVWDEEVKAQRRKVTVQFDLEKLREKVNSLSMEDEENKETNRMFRARIKPQDNEAAENELKKAISKDMFSEMEILGQFNLGFLITRLGDDLFIIDQHATDEKYNFETLQKDHIIKKQKLIIPQTLELTAVNEAILIDHVDIFLKNGFEFDIDHDGPVTKRIKLVSIPISKNWTFGKEDIDEMLFMLQDNCDGASLKNCRPSRVRAMFASRACRKSIMIGTALSMRDMRSLVDHMGQLEQPWNCPHGRPTMRHLVNLEMLSSIKEDQ